jgi:hypothetical protein
MSLQNKRRKSERKNEIMMDKKYHGLKRSMGGDIFNHQSKGGGRKTRTVMGFGKPEGISSPDGHQSIAISAECMLYHILYAVRLRRAPDHDIEPSLGLWSKEISAEGGEVWPWHDATWCWTLMKMVLTAIGFWDARRA